MTKPGLLLTSEAVSIVSVIRTQRFPWEQVSGFMGERSHDEARVLMVLEDERQIPLPGTLDPEELDPYGDEGQMLSAADQLNHLREVAIAGDLPAPAAPSSTAPAPSGLAHGEAESEPARRISARSGRSSGPRLKAVRLDPERQPRRRPIRSPRTRRRAA